MVESLFCDVHSAKNWKAISRKTDGFFYFRSHNIRAHLRRGGRALQITRQQSAHHGVAEAVGVGQTQAFLVGLWHLLATPEALECQ